MEKLKDYSGEFRPDFCFEDFTKEAVIRIIKAYRGIYRTMVEIVHDVCTRELKGKVSEEKFKATWDQVCNDHAYKVAIPQIKEALNLHQEDDLSILYKYFQICCDSDALEEGLWGNIKGLEDYLAKDRKEFNLSALSEEEVNRVIRAYRKIYQFWRNTARPVLQELFDNIDEFYAAWNEHCITHTQAHWIPLLRSAGNIRTNDVAGLFKAFQLGPDGVEKAESTEQCLWRFSYDWKDRYDLTYTGDYCAVAEMFEKAQDWERLGKLCADGHGSSEHLWYLAACEAWHPKMRAEWPLLPPRKDPNGPFCKWRFYVPEEDRKQPYRDGYPADD